MMRKELAPIHDGYTTACFHLSIFIASMTATRVPKSTKNRTDIFHQANFLFLAWTFGAKPMAYKNIMLVL